MTDSILITGASSGIGAELAKAYAGPETTIFLGGRQAGRLTGVAERCREAGAACHEHIADVTDREAMKDWVLACDRAVPLDLVIANAGISAGSGDTGEAAEQARHLFCVNVDGVFNTVLPVIPAMLERGRGHIALMSSLASFRGFPGAPAYCASKAALRVWGEGQRGGPACLGRRPEGLASTPWREAVSHLPRFRVDSNEPRQSLHHAAHLRC